MEPWDEIMDLDGEPDPWSPIGDNPHMLPIHDEDGEVPGCYRTLPAKRPCD